MKRKKTKVKKGQRWIENDNRRNRIVEVLGIIGKNIIIRTVKKEYGGISKITVANKDRFNNSRNGYSMEKLIKK